ncbi:MAG TPA: AsmA family protein, partial [Gemmatimonadaceae bacterium]|nr:AsmA family protein [Gemmatimonadaceae bacterium]
MNAARMDANVSPSSKWPRRLRNGATTVAVVVAVYALLGFLVLPLAVKPKLEAQLSQQLGRRATLARVEFNPFTLRARLLDFALTDRDPARGFARFERLDLDVSPASLTHLAPVLDDVRLVRPEIDLVRNADATYNIDDLVARPAPPAAAAAPPPAFSLNNIVVENGSISLDDRVHGRKLVVSSLGISIPFLSSIAHDAQIHVTPRL